MTNKTKLPRTYHYLDIEEIEVVITMGIKNVLSRNYNTKKELNEIREYVIGTVYTIDIDDLIRIHKETFKKYLKVEMKEGRKFEEMIESMRSSLFNLLMAYALRQRTLFTTR
jgi:hypothetical protein